MPPRRKLRDRLDREKLGKLYARDLWPERRRAPLTLTWDRVRRAIHLRPTIEASPPGLQQQGEKTMLFMVAGHLKPGAEHRLIDFSAEFNEHLAQPFRDIVIAGALRDGDGRRRGYMAFINADSIDEAERYLHESPYYLEGLYERCEVFRYDVQVGTLESDRKAWTG